MVTIATKRVYHHKQTFEVKLFAIIKKYHENYSSGSTSFHNIITHNIIFNKYYLYLLPWKPKSHTVAKIMNTNHIKN